MKSADIMALLCSVEVHIHVNNFSKSTRPRQMLFLLKIIYLSRMKNYSRHANLFSGLVPPPKV